MRRAASGGGVMSTLAAPAFRVVVSAARAGKSDEAIRAMRRNAREIVRKIVMGYFSGTAGGGDRGDCNEFFLGRQPSDDLLGGEEDVTWGDGFADQKSFGAPLAGLSPA